MKKILKKIISYLLIICMILPVVPMQAFAAEGLSITGGKEGEDYIKSGDIIIIKTSAELTISGVTTTQRIEVDSNVTANVTLNGVNIKVINASAVKINDGSTLNLKIEGTNSLTGKKLSTSTYYAGINVPENATLNISGTGSLEAKSLWDYNGEEQVSSVGAGIGANDDYSDATIFKAGKINIVSGTIKAIGGIGVGGLNADITISGGTVSTENTAQIGLGGESSKIEIIDGNVNVGGEVINYGNESQTLYTPCALGGENSAVNIKGGTVTAMGGDVGIGGTNSSTTIDGGTVTAKGTRDVAIGGQRPSITINDGTVKAFGLNTGIGSEFYNWANEADDSLSVNINGGDITAWGGCDFSEDAQFEEGYDFEYRYDGEYGIGGDFHHEPQAQSIIITGGKIDAKAGKGGIGSNFDEKIIGNDNYNWNSTEELLIKISGGEINAEATWQGCGIGGLMNSYDHRKIEITGGTINAIGRGSGGAGIGGGDCGDGSTDRSIIRIAGDAYIKNAIGYGGGAGIGASGYDNNENPVGFGGGKIIIEGNASIGGKTYSDEGAKSAIQYSGLGASAGIGGSGGDVIKGGSGGYIEINTTGNINASSIGGGSACHKKYVNNSNVYIGVGGDGGTIIINNGTIVGHYNTIGKFNKTSEGDYVGYASAFIGGGGGYEKGGNGGNITINGGNIGISNGTISSNLVLPKDDSYKFIPGIDGVGGAAIGGGNGADGGNITINGGRFNMYFNSNYKDENYTGSLPALIGGGTKGCSGDIVISGGHIVDTTYNKGNNMIGHGTNYSGTDGSVKITGGSIKNIHHWHAEEESVIRPEAVNNSGQELHLVYTFSPNQDSQVDEYYNEYREGEILSLEIADYPYGFKDMKYEYFCMRLPQETLGKAIKATVKAGNTYYDLEGVITANLGSNSYETKLKSVNSYTNTISLTIGNDDLLTYNGLSQAPSVTVKDSAGNTLVKDTDYDVEYKKISYLNETPIYEAVTDIINAGGYRIVVNGKDTYAGMTDYKDMLINPKHIPSSYDGTLYTKQYDGNTDVFDAEGKKVDEIAITVKEGICDGDTITNPKLTNLRYKQAGIGKNIEIYTNSATYDEILGGNYNYNYSIDNPADLKGDITTKVIGESNISQGTLKITKTYDGNKTVNISPITGNLKLVNLVGEEVANISISSYGEYSDANVGDDKEVIVTLGTLTGANSENYTLAGGATTFKAKASILPADYTYTVDTEQEIKKGSGLSAIVVPEKAVGVGAEKVNGNVSWFTDSQRTQVADDNYIKNLAVGTKATLYLKFNPDVGQTNYSSTPKEGLVNLKIVSGDPQDLTFKQSEVVKVYGDDKFTNAAENKSVKGGAITYTSDNTDVAVVNANTGEVTVVGTGNAKITATAALLEGVWAETKVSYNLTVNKKPVTVTVDDKTKVYGEKNPELTFTYLDTDLVGNDKVEDLGIVLNCTATQKTPVGTDVKITGSGESKNYVVTVVSAKLIINKASAPVVNDVERSVYYNTDNKDVFVNIIGFPSDCGTIKFDVVSVTTQSSIGTTQSAIIGATPTVDSNGVVKLSTVKGNIGDKVTLIVEIIMQNYETASTNVTVTFVNKIPVNISGVKVNDKVYDGTAVKPSGEISTGEYKDELVYAYSSSDGGKYSGNQAPIEAGKYKLIVSVPENNNEYIGSSVPVEFTINKAKLTVKPSSNSIYKGNAIPTFTVVYEGLKGNDKSEDVCNLLSGSLDISAYNENGTLLENTDNVGTYAVKFTGNPVFKDAKNYDISVADGTLTIQKKSSGGSTGGTTPAPTNTDTNNTGVTTSQPTATVTGKTATSTISSSDASKLVTDAVANKTKEIVITPVIKKSADVTKTILDIPVSAIKDIAQKTKADVKVETPVGNLTFDAEALDSIANQVKGSNMRISVEKVDVDKLSEENKEAVGDSLVIDLTITSNNEKISNFGEGTVTASVPYNLKDNEIAEGIIIWYLADDGTLKKIEDAYYDVKTGCVVFTTNHFSYYVVGYDGLAAWDNPFTDVKDSAWYYENVYYMSKNGLMNGISKATFNPNGTTSRSMIVTILWRLEGSMNAATNSFNDVEDTWYTNAVAWASNNGIVSGYGNGKFGPNDTITREQMASIIYNYAKYKGYDVTTNTNVLSFSDTGSISSWAKDAMSFVVENGIMTGKDNNKLDPKATATRAEVAAIIQRTVEQLGK